MNEELKCSIILPVYNVEQYLCECLETVSRQTHKNIEIILIDDGSTDHSGSIIDEFAKKDKRTKVIHKQNGGVSSARNIGIDIATGDYICFADSDDILEDDYVDYLLNLCLKNHAEIALTTQMFTTFYTTPQTSHDLPKLCTGEEAAVRILYYQIPIGCYCKMFRRDFIENHHIRFSPEIYIGEGFNFNVTAFQMAEKVVLGKRKVYCYRRDNSTSAMTKFTMNKAAMAMHAIEIIKESLLINTQKLIEACRYAEWHTAEDMYNWMVLAKSKREFPEMYQRCYRIIRKYSWNAIFAPVNKKERYRAIMCLIHPRIMAWQLELRRLLFSKKVSK